MAASLETRVMQSVVLQIALAAASVLLAVLVHLSPAGPIFNLAGLFVFAVLAAAWFGGARAGLLAALLATLSLPQLIAVGYPLRGGFVALPHFITFSGVGLVVGWGSARRVRALRDQERYARAMHAGDDGFWDCIVASDTIHASSRLLEIFGFAPGSRFAGREDLMAQIPFEPEDRVRLLQALADHFAGKAARFGAEARFIRDGETRWVQLRGMAARDPSGAVARWTGTVRDVTERKRAEEALRESEQRYELAMAASESGYWDWHIPSDTYFASPRAFELAGFPRGTTWVDRKDYKARINMHPEDFIRWEAAREALFAGTGERLAMEVRYVVNGEGRWHNLQAICRRDDSGKVVRWTGSATDITSRKRAEKEVRTMERMLRRARRLESIGTLAGGVAHDFNNILGAILGYCEMAQRSVPQGTRLARDVDNIMIAGERGRALVERLLAFSRSAGGTRVPIAVEDVVREVLNMVTAKLPSGVTVRAELHGGAASVLGDATQIHQVVANLATNAIQAMPSGGILRIELKIERIEARQVVTIGARGVGDQVVLVVADTGGGISAEIIDRVFDPFFTTKQAGSGTGLGLSLVHSIVSELGGAIDVESTPGIGSTFTVYLPRCLDAPIQSGEAVSAPPRGGGQRVLIVDDEEPLVQLATRTLADLGYEPIGFTSSTAALKAFHADPDHFDVLVTDEIMPDMSGSTLIREVRGLRSTIPVLLMSGYLTERAHVGGTAPASIGADEVLQKPLLARDLAASLARVLRLSS